MFRLTFSDNKISWSKLNKKLNECNMSSQAGYDLGKNEKTTSSRRKKNVTQK